MLESKLSRKLGTKYELKQELEVNMKVQRDMKTKRAELVLLEKEQQGGWGWLMCCLEN